MLKVKLLSSGKSLTPYISRVVTNGLVQKAFREQIGIPTGRCVASEMRRGMSKKERIEVFKRCATPKNTRLDLTRGL